MSKAWDSLSMSEKSEMMKVAIKNGITNLDEIRKRYNEFAEGGNLYAEGGNTDDDLVDWIIKEEGFLANPKDIGDGKITLGSGLTNPKWVNLYKKRGNKWSREDNRRAVAEEVASRRKWAEANIPNWDSLPKNSQKALLSYKYNYDFTKDNSPKLFKALEDSNLQEAARQMDATSKIPTFRKGLEARRRREQKWFLSDVVPVRPPKSYNPAPVDNTYMYNPFAVAVENIQPLPIMVPDTDRYITTHEITPTQDKSEKYYEQAENRRRFDALMNLLSIPSNPRPQYVPKSNLHFNAQEPLIDYAIRANGGYLGEGANYYGFGDWLKRGWNALKNTAQVAAIAENPSVMTAAGWRIGRDGKAVQDRQNAEDVRQLRENLATIGEAGLTAPTLTKDVEGVYQAVRHPAQTAKAAKETAKAVYESTKEAVKKSKQTAKNAVWRSRPNKLSPNTLKLNSSSEKHSVSELSNQMQLALREAQQYKTSPKYKELVEKAREESERMGTGEFIAETFTENPISPKITFSSRTPGSLGSYTPYTNIIDIDPVQADLLTPYHEALHWQRIAAPNIYVGPKYEKWAKAYDAGENPVYVKSLFEASYKDPVENMRMMMADNAREYLKRKTNSVLYSHVPSDAEMRKPWELKAHTMTAGKRLGLQPFEPFPKLTKDNVEYLANLIGKARKSDNMLWDIKAGTFSELKDFWDLLTGQYIPTVTGITIGTSIANNSKN